MRGALSACHFQQLTPALAHALDAQASRAMYTDADSCFACELRAERSSRSAPPQPLVDLWRLSRHAIVATTTDASDARAFAGVVGLVPHGGGVLLCSLCVAPSLRAHGVGAALLDAGVAAAPSDAPIFLYVIKGDGLPPFPERTRKLLDFYGRRGFAVVGEDRDRFCMCLARVP
jgi:GNAT superfamily N-acetyltransferase